MSEGSEKAGEAATSVGEKETNSTLGSSDPNEVKDDLSDVDLNDDGQAPMSSEQASTEATSSATRTRSQAAIESGASLAPDGTQLESRDAIGVGHRLSHWKTWGVTRIKCARQSLSERFGKGTRTVDRQLDEHVEDLREAHRKYELLIQHAKKMSTQMSAFLETQRSMSEILMDSSVRAKSLEESMRRSALAQRQAVRNGEMLVACLEFFHTSVLTLLTKTMGDTFSKVKEYEAVRVRYDAFRSDLESLRYAVEANPNNASKKNKLDQAELDFEANKTQYDNLRSDVSIKLKYLDENRVS